MTMVTCTVENNIAHVRLDRPEKRNALTLQTLSDLRGTARTLSRDKSLRAVVISGEGESFCAGLDFGSVLKEPTGIVRNFLPVPFRGTNGFQEACWAWRRLGVPVIAAVHGHCLGGGMQIALAADFRISTPDATWSVLEGKWGIIPDMTGVRSLAELVGIDTAKRLTMTAEMISGKEAADLGLVTDIDSDPVRAAYELAEKLKQRSPDQLSATKRIFNDTWALGPSATFARERVEQLWLLAAKNTAAARKAAFGKGDTVPVYRPRRR